MLPPGWTLNYEAIFYLIFTALLFAPGKARFVLLILALVGVCAIGFLDPPLYGLGANPMMLQFAAGAWLGRRHVLGRQRSGRRGRDLRPHRRRALDRHVPDRLSQ